MIINIKKEGKRIYADWLPDKKYMLSYDIEKDEYKCECLGWVILQRCKHIKAFKQKLEVIE